jgi:amidophosphoribosyltransferase
VFAHELQHQQPSQQPTPEQVFAAVRGVHERCRGAYAAILLIVGGGIVAFRDRFGIRPLVYGKRVTDAGTEYMVASESVALDMLEFELIRDVAPGEAIYIDLEGNLHHRMCAEHTKLTPCIFEHVYLARPDSIIDRVSVYKARLRMGEALAEQIRARYPDGRHDIDVVIPIPDTGRTAALPLAHQLNVKYREGFVKNRYIGRTFIMPGQSERKRSIRAKLNAIDLEFRDKNVLLVDDSIVRSNTIRQIIQLARLAGARRVYVASAAPPIRYPNVYGIDMPAASELVAANRTEDEVGRMIGADWLVYQRLEDLIAAAREGNPHIEQFECSVFDGHYVTGDVSDGYLNRLHEERTDGAKQAREELRLGLEVL